MSKKLVIGILAVLLFSTVGLGGLFAQAGTGGVAVSTTGTAASGATVSPWSVGNPSWSPIEGTVGVINGGGITRIHLPTSPAGKWAITLFLDDPDELISAYSSWNPRIQVRTISGLINGAAVPTVVSGGNASSSAFTLGTEVNDANTNELSQILTLEKGFVTFVVNSSDGVPVDTSAVYDTSGENRVFEIGISTPTATSNAGTFFTKDASTADNMSPEFSIEVRQQSGAREQRIGRHETTNNLPAATGVERRGARQLVGPDRGHIHHRLGQRHRRDRRECDELDLGDARLVPHRGSGGHHRRRPRRRRWRRRRPGHLEGGRIPRQQL